LSLSSSSLLQQFDYQKNVKHIQTYRIHCDYDDKSDNKFDIISNAVAI